MSCKHLFSKTTLNKTGNAASEEQTEDAPLPKRCHFEQWNLNATQQHPVETKTNQC